MKCISVILPLDLETTITQVFNRQEGKITAFTFSGEGDIRVSDDYHSMSDLYDHRSALFAAFCNYINHTNNLLSSREEVWKSRFHSDGTMFEGMFIAGIRSREGQIHYHMELDWWDKFKIPEIEKAPEWDGALPEENIKRLIRL